MSAEVVDRVRLFAKGNFASRYAPLGLVATATLLLLFHLVFRSPAYPFTSDSAHYIEQGRNLLQHGFPAITPTRLDQVDVAQIPSALFPPGLPLMLAALGLLGIDPRAGSVGIGWVSSLLLPIAIYWACHRRMSSLYAAAAAFLGTLSIGVVDNSGLGLTDVPALLLSVLTVGVLFNYTTPQAAAIVGILSGASYVIRNQQAALLAALALFFIFVLVVKRERNAARRAVAFAVGVSSVIFPYFLWNFHVFGTPAPYEMSPSTVPLFENARAYLYAFLHNVTATWAVPKLLTKSAPGLAMLAVICGFVVAAGSIFWRAAKSEARQVAFFCFMFVTLGSALVVIARSRFQWGEFIGIRHVLPYGPFTFIGVLVLLDPNNRLQRLAGFWRFVGSAVAALLVLVGLLEARQIFRNPPDWSKAHITAFEEGKTYLCSPGDSFLVSNWSQVFRIQCASPVRFSGYFNVGRDPTIVHLRKTPETYDIATGIEQMMPKLPAGKRTIVALFPEGAGVSKMDLPLSAADESKLVNLGWVPLANDATKLVVSFEKP